MLQYAHELLLNEGAASIFGDAHSTANSNVNIMNSGGAVTVLLHLMNITEYRDP